VMPFVGFLRARTRCQTVQTAPPARHAISGQVWTGLQVVVDIGRPLSCDPKPVEELMMRPQQDPADELAGVFARMSGMLLTEQTVADALALITSLAKDTLVGSTGSGVTLMSATGDRITSAATEPIVEQLDTLQYALDQGPCLTAWHDRTIVRSDDLSSDDRWPVWSAQASHAGVRSVLSAAIATADTALGAIKVYSLTTGSYDATSEDILRRFADQAAVLLSNVRTVQAAKQFSAQLQETLRGRETIAIARGVVMARKQLDQDAAYRYLLALSHRTRVPVRELAEKMVTFGSVRTDID
jgi:GAF domain-containing protein